MEGVHGSATAGVAHCANPQGRLHVSHRGADAVGPRVGEILQGACAVLQHLRARIAELRAAASALLGLLRPLHSQPGESVSLPPSLAFPFLVSS